MTIGVKGTPPLIRCGLLLLAAAGAPGCRWGDRHPHLEHISVIDGLSVLEFDGLNLRLKRATEDTKGLLLLVNGHAVEQVELRPGDGFVITDGRHVHTAYQVLAVSDDRVTLKRHEVRDRRATGDGVRTTEDVIVVTPYNLEDTD